MNQLTVSHPGKKPCLTTGYRTYLIGSQDGLFPEKGEHIAGEMYGIWSLPIKISDGFWMKVNGEWLTSPEECGILPYGMTFTYPMRQDVSTERFQFVPREAEGVCLSYRFCNHGQEPRTLSLRFVLKSELFPAWLSERLGKQDFPDSAVFEKAENRIRFKDAGNPWYLLAGASRPIEAAGISCEMEAPEAPRGKGVYGAMEFTVTVAAGSEETLWIFLASSSESGEDAAAQYRELSENHLRLLEEKRALYEDIDRRAVLSVSGLPQLEEMYRWTKYNNDWAIRTVPRQGTGAAAGYPEFPWWFGHDSTYFLKSFLVTGDYEICRKTLRLIRDASDRVNGNGRVVHEIAPNGQVFYEGMLTETPQFASFLWFYYQWTGDREFLAEMYPFVRQGVEWVRSQCVEGLPYGYGAAEYNGFNCIVFDCAAWSLRGYETAALIARELGQEREGRNYETLFRESYDRFQKLFWLEDKGLYADMAGTRQEITDRAKAWRISLKSFPLDEDEEYEGGESCSRDKTPREEELKRRIRENMDSILEQAGTMKDGELRAFHFLGLSSVSTLWEMGYLPEGRAEIARKAEEDPQNVYLEREYSKYSTMPIGTARVMQQFARQKDAEELVNALLYLYDGFGAAMPGATSEYYPDKGCFVQIWNNEATMTSYTQCILGLSPFASRKKLTLSPCISPRLGSLTLKAVSVGDGIFDFSYDADSRKITVTGPSGWKVCLSGGDCGLEYRER